MKSLGSKLLSGCETTHIKLVMPIIQTYVCMLKFTNVVCVLGMNLYLILPEMVNECM